MGFENSQFFVSEGMHDEFSRVFGYQKEDVPSTDRRRQPRIKDSIFIFCRETHEARVIEGVTNDICSGGLCFDSPERLAPGTEVRLEMYTPLDYHKRVLESLYVSGRVTWCVPLGNDPGSNEYRVGLRFEAVSAEDDQKISRYVEDGFTDRR